MKLPFIKYLEALVSCRFDNEKIKKLLNDLPIPLAKNFPDLAIFKVRKVLEELDPDYFKTPFKNDFPDLDILKSRGIFDITHYLLRMDTGYSLKFIKGAFDLVQDPDMFKKMTSLAMSNVTKEDIELLVRGKYNIHFNELEIKTFLDLFFNLEGWSLSDKKEYIKYIDDTDLKDFYEMAVEGDKSYLMWKLGIAPQVSIEQMLHDITSDAYYMFKEKSRYSPNESQTWAALLLRSIERAEKLQGDKDKNNDFFKDLTDLITESKINSDKIKAIQKTVNDPIKHISIRIKEDKDNGNT